MITTNVIIGGSFMAVIFLLFLYFIYKANKNDNAENFNTYLYVANSFEMQGFIENAIRQINLRKKLVAAFFYGVAIVASVIFFISTVRDTNSIGKNLLGTELYNARMKSSYTYSFGLFIVLAIVVTPFVVLSSKWYNRYIKIFPTLSNEDIRKLNKMNDWLSFFQKYCPPYIIRQKEAIFFNFLGNERLNLGDCTNIQEKRFYTRGGSGFTVTVTMKNGVKRLFGIRSNYYLLFNLIAEIRSVNPNVTVNTK